MTARSIMANGEKIRTLRRRLGFSQEALAIAVGCDVKTVHNAELGRRVHIETLVGIAKALGFDFSVVHIGSNDSDELLELRLQKIDHWRDSFDRKSLPLLIEIYHDNAEVSYPGIGFLDADRCAVGRPAIRDQLDAIFHRFQFDPWQETSASIDATGNFVFLRGELTGIIRNTGKRFTTLAIHEFEFDDRWVRRHTGMFDTSSLDPSR